MLSNTFDAVSKTQLVLTIGGLTAASRSVCRAFYLNRFARIGVKLTNTGSGTVDGGVV